MRYERRQNADGSHYYRFTYYDSKLKKPVHLTRAETRKRFGKDILTEEEANECLKLLSAKYETEKIRIQRRLTWESEFYSFAKLLEDYAVKQKKRAPNSWENNVFYLKHYVLYFFLQDQRLNMIDLWPDHFEKFKDWLETAKRVRGKGQIAYSSKNHAIKALNTFLDHLEREKVIVFTQRCSSFPEHLLNTRTLDDVILENEMEIIYGDLMSAGHRSEAIFYRFLYFSGMRFNEGKAISVANLFQGEIEGDFMRAKLNAYEIKYHGYIVSEGQLDRVTSAGKVIRAPFKGRKKIEEKHNRILPIEDKELWNQLVVVAEEKFNSKPNGLETSDCLLFGDINDTTATTRLQESYSRKNLKWRPWHCLRHSRATFVIGKTSDTMLARIWLGHSSPRTLERYNHLFQAVTRAAKALEQTGKKFGLRKV